MSASPNTLDPTGPRQPRSTVLSVEDKAIIVVFRGHTLLRLDDRQRRSADGCSPFEKDRAIALGQDEGRKYPTACG
jgi:hypothetical protein